MRSGALDRRGTRAARDEAGGIPYRWLLMLALVRGRGRASGQTSSAGARRPSSGP